MRTISSAPVPGVPIATANSALAGRLAATQGGPDFRACRADTAHYTRPAKFNLPASNIPGLSNAVSPGMPPSDNSGARRKAGTNGTMRGPSCTGIIKRIGLAMIVFVWMPLTAHAFSLLGDDISASITAPSTHTSVLSDFTPATVTVGSGAEFGGSMRRVFGLADLGDLDYGVVVDFSDTFFTVSFTEIGDWGGITRIGVGGFGLHHLHFSGLNGGAAITSVSINEALSTTSGIAPLQFEIGFDGSSIDVLARSGGPGEIIHFDIGTAIVPIPAALYLFASALGLLGWIRNRAI